MPVAGSQARRIMFTKLALVTLVGARALADCVPPEVSQYHAMGCNTPDCEGLDLMPAEAECQVSE